MTSAVATQDIEAIAKKLVEKCRKQAFQEAEQELYSEDNRSVESCGMPGKPIEIKGLKAVLEKSKEWLESTEIHSLEVSEPMVAESHFAVKFTMDATDKKSGERHQMSELGIYEVKNGKIVREEFFYAAE